MTHGGARGWALGGHAPNPHPVERPDDWVRPDHTRTGLLVAHPRARPAPQDTCEAQRAEVMLLAREKLNDLHHLFVTLALFLPPPP